MVIKIYISSTSGNIEMKKNQEFIRQILSGKSISFEEVDISDPNLEDDRVFMRKNATAKEGQKYPLPPQIFNDDTYCGDFDHFHEANETEELMTFLKLGQLIDNVNGHVNGHMNGHTNGHSEEQDPVDMENGEAN